MLQISEQNYKDDINSFPFQRLLIPSANDGVSIFLTSPKSPYINAFQNNVDESSIVSDKNERLKRLLLEPKTAVFSSVQHVILSQEYKKCLVS